jgi:hypothetical protein
MRPGEVSRATDFGHPVRVAFELPLLPTADPLVFDYHPGHPPSVFPPTVRVAFAEPPPLPLPAPLVVVIGILERRDGSDRKTNGEVGVVVISGAAVVPRSSR